MVKDLDFWLDDIQCQEVDQYHIDQNPNSLKAGMDGWWYVSTGEDGAIAYFWNETDANRFRLDLVNRKINP